MTPPTGRTGHGLARCKHADQNENTRSHKPKQSPCPAACNKDAGGPNKSPSCHQPPRRKQKKALCASTNATTPPAKLYAGPKFTQPPSPSAVPQPPSQWVGSQGACMLSSPDYTFQMKDLQMYEVYILNKPSSEKLWIKYSDCTFFQECQKNLKRLLGLDSYLPMPVQRLTTYQQILKDMLKYSTDCEGAADLQEALTSISAILDPVNYSLHRIIIRGFKGNLNELGKLLMQGSFTVWKDHKRHHGKFPYVSRVQPKQRHLFLFENAPVFCKRREEEGKGYIYTFERSLSMSDVDIVVNFYTFEIWCTSRKKVYVVEAPSAEIKTTWVNELKKVVAAQREACREASQQRAPDQGFSETESLRTPPTDHETQHRV